MAQLRALMPPKPSPAFPEPFLLPARRLTGVAVLLPVESASNKEEAKQAPQRLERRASVSSNILCVDNGGKPQYFWLQRKIRTTSKHGSVRVGFVLKDPAENSESDPSSTGEVVWEVVSKEADANGAGGDSQQVQMVAIQIENKNDPSNELAVLQWVAKHATDGNNNVLCSVLGAADSRNVFTVSPYDCVQQTLFEYCSEQPGNIVSESTARGFFREITKVRRSFLRAGD